MVIWSPLAKEEYAALLQYLDTNFGTDAALKMMDNVEETIERIAELPNAYPVSAVRPDVRRAVITAQISLFYRLLDSHIQLLHLWDNRQDPERLKESF